MDNTTSIALSRLMAQQRAMDVTANNIANAGTPGYRAERTQFSDWLVRQPAVPGLPAGDRALVFTQDRATWRERQPGPLTHTANPFDIAIGNPAGWFSVQTPSGARLTRAGHFMLSPSGRIVDPDGNALLDRNGQPLAVAPADTQITVAGDGTISSQNGQLGSIGVVAPSSEANLQAQGGRLYATTDPTAPVAAPQLVQGAVQESNVQPIAEITRMMDDVREFQFVSQFVQGEADRQSAAIDKILNRNG